MFEEIRPTQADDMAKTGWARLVKGGTRVELV